MLKGLSALALRALPLLLLSAPAWAGTEYHVRGLAGYPGNPALVQQDLSTSQNITSIASTPGVVIFEFDAGDDLVNLEFNPPHGGSLAPGMDEGAPFQSPVAASFSLGVLPQCNNRIERFVIRDMVTSGSSVTTFAVDFEVDCGGVPALAGSFRDNSSVPLSIDAPTADAGLDQRALPGDGVTLHGLAFMPGNGTITGYHWTQLSGPTVTLADPTSASTTFTAPAVALGGADVVLQLEVDNSLSLSSTDTVTVHVANAMDPTSALNIVSDPGDPLGGGKTTTLDVANAVFIPGLFDPHNIVEVSVSDGRDNWDIKMSGVEDATLLPGTYDPADGSIESALPAVEVAIDGDECDFSSPARFVVFDAQFSGTTLVSFAADFEIHCNGDVPAFHGKLRYNSAYPVNDPVADVGLQFQPYVAGDTVDLTATASDPGAGNTVVTYQWTQISGTEVVLSDPNTAIAAFTAPSEPPGGEDLVFELTIVSSDGLSSSEQITIHVASSSDPITGLFVDGSADGQTDSQTKQLFQLHQAKFTLARNPQMVVLTATRGELSWQATFVPPPGEKLHIGTYTGVVTVGQHKGTAAGMTVGPNGFKCSEVTGSFKVLQIAYDKAGQVTQLAVDFIQHCFTGPIGLYGKVRYQSDIALRTPTAIAGLPQSSFSGLPVVLDGSTSDAGFGTAIYTWTQLVKPGDPVVKLPDPNSPKLLFVAPDVPPGGRTLVFQLALQNPLGLTSEDTVMVDVGNEGDKKTVLYYESDPDDAAGQGGYGLVMGPEFPLPGFGDVDTLVASNIVLTPDHPWNLEFSEPHVVTLGSFTTDGANPATIRAIFGNTPFCATTTGQFMVRKLKLKDIQTDEISSMAVDFVQHCDGSSAELRGAYRFNSTIPIAANDPVAVTGPDQLLHHAGLVILDGSQSSSLSGSITSYMWRQLAGPTVKLVGLIKSPAISFQMPDGLFTAKGTTLVFELAVTDAFGLTGRAQVNVVGQSDVTSSLSLQSDAGDPIGQGESVNVDLPDSAISVTKLHDLSIHAALNTGGISSLTLAAPDGRLLLPGEYTDAIAYAPKAPLPSLSVAAGSRSCAKSTGDFKVLDVLYGNNGAVLSLAVDFDQRCRGASGALHGKLRYHSSVP
jgi:hypothetical protein